MNSGDKGEDDMIRVILIVTIGMIVYYCAEGFLQKIFSQNS